MKKIILPLLLLGLLSGSAQAQNKKAAAAAPKAPKTEAPASTSLRIGTPAPLDGLMLMGADGRPTSLMQAKTEKGLLVMFSCNTCPFVIKAQQRTTEALQVAKKLGFGVVIVNSNEAQRDSLDSAPAMQRYAAEQGYDVPYLVDQMSQLADAFGATRTPEVFLFNGEGLLVYKGALEDNPADPAKSTKFYLTEALKAVANNKSFAPAETRSIGCSIKRRDS